ncbi:MAG: 2-haloacid dehalogenase [Halanaerobiales bacterium]|nr:2-haloacid dehalogenase [Halanaerobiales bacterium]
MSDMKYEVILFDADGTLFDFEKAEDYALEKTVSFFELKYNRDYHLKHFRDINLAIWEEFERGLISAAELKTERFKRLFERLKISIKLRHIYKVKKHL